MQLKEINCRYLIIGQGIAGTTLAYTLLKRKQNIYVIDDGYQHSSSMVAVGMFNPITGKRLVKTWKADVLFPFLHHFYQELESFLGVKFFFPKTIYRPFENIEQQNHVLGQAAEQTFANFIAMDSKDEKYKNFVFNEFGGIEVKQGGYVAVSTMLEGFRDFLKREQIFLQASFDENKLSIDNRDSITWQDVQIGLRIKAGKIIFCRGIKDGESLFWRDLPFRKVKGEVLTGYFQGQLGFEEIVNRSGWVIPFGKDTYKAGSTYDWDDTSLEITEKAKSEILDKVSKLIKLPFVCTHQEVGLRPTTTDRRPLIGLHPNYPNIGLFNGLGTKGVILAPYFADVFCEYLLEGKTLEEEVSVQRFFYT